MPQRQISPDSFGAGWRGTSFGTKEHVLIKRSPQEYIVGTGADVIVYLEIPYPHRFASLEFKHTTVANVDSLTAHDIYFARYKWSGTVPPWLIFSAPASVVADDGRIAGDGYEYPPGRYRLITNATATRRIFPAITIQILTRKGKEIVHPGYPAIPRME